MTVVTATAVLEITVTAQVRIGEPCASTGDRGEVSIEEVEFAGPLDTPLPIGGKLEAILLGLVDRELREDAAYELDAETAARWEPHD